MPSAFRETAGTVTATLARSRLGVWPLVFTVMAAAAPLTVVAGGATTGFAVTGITGIPIAYVIIALVLAVFSVGYVAMSRRILNAGAFYTYVTHGLGKPLGVGSAFVALVGYNTMQIGLYGGFGGVLAPFLAARFGVHLPWWLCAYAAWAIVALLGVRRIDLNSRVLAILLIAEIAVAVGYAIVQVSHPAPGGITVTTLSLGNVLTGGIGAALAVAVAGFVGFEGTAVFSEESKDPHKTVARATYLALTIIGLLYAFCAWAMSVATGPDRIVDAARSDGTELIFTLVAPYVGQTMIDLGHLLFITSLFAALLAFHNTAARYFFALGREGVLPGILGRTSPRTRAPLTGSLTQTALAALVLAVYAIAGWDPIVRLFFWLTVLGGLGVLILMVATSIAVIAYFARPANRADLGVGRGLFAPIVATAALGAVLVVTLDQFATLLGVDPASDLRWQLPAVYAVAAAVGVVWALILRTTRPQTYAAIGRGANSVTTDDRTLTPTGR
ncbi:amino acid permease [Actinoplanes sp. ATCC 53533]|uniref:APC family permease n=1 Tax=Actinoplanes sp. ATCC 53533 TaxID=1288362 RepID=UPI000F78A1CB|nr:APC family permease [Actinoplanes sp. ATCC 53533]RSM43874.1 amino acid permease [Actinoplanes sp. ATCC 53533]